MGDSIRKIFKNVCGVGAAPSSKHQLAPGSPSGGLEQAPLPPAAAVTLHLPM